MPGTIFKFTVTDGVNTLVCELVDDKTVTFDDYGHPIYTFTFANVQGKLIIDIDEENSRLVQNQFQISYSYYFGGQTNDWLQGVVNTSSVINSDSNGIIYNLIPLSFA